MSGTNIGETEDYYRKKITTSTEALLIRLIEHHDYNLPKPTVIPIVVKDEPEPIEISVLPLEYTSPTIEGIKRVVCGQFGLTHEQLLSDRRHSEVVRARQVVMYLGREKTRISYPRIGKKLGGMDHSTVIYGANKIAELILTDWKLAHDVAEIEARL